MTVIAYPRGIKPVPNISGFLEGYALDYHTISCELSDDPYCQYRTKRTVIGELIYKLKYKSSYISDKERLVYLDQLVEILYKFIHSRRWSSQIQCIIPAPRSLNRSFQPVVEISQKLAKMVGVPCLNVLYKKGMNPKQMKNIEDYEERRLHLVKEVCIDPVVNIRGNKVLLLEDIFDSGSTFRRCIEVLSAQAGTRGIYALAITRTKR